MLSGSDIIVLYRTRRSEARIQQMLWKVNYSDIGFAIEVCITMLLVFDTVM